MAIVIIKKSQCEIKQKIKFSNGCKEMCFICRRMGKIDKIFVTLMVDSCVYTHIILLKYVYLKKREKNLFRERLSCWILFFYQERIFLDIKQ
jgi:hypothetical protein